MYSYQTLDYFPNHHSRFHDHLSLIRRQFFIDFLSVVPNYFRYYYILSNQHSDLNHRLRSLYAPYLAIKHPYYHTSHDYAIFNSCLLNYLFALILLMYPYFYLHSSDLDDETFEDYYFYCLSFGTFLKLTAWFKNRLNLHLN